MKYSSVFSKPKNIKKRIICKALQYAYTAQRFRMPTWTSSFNVEIPEDTPEAPPGVIYSPPTPPPEE